MTDFTNFRLVRLAGGRSGTVDLPRSKRQLRNRSNTDLEQEKKILDEVLANAATGGVVIIPGIKLDIEVRLGKTLALSSVYRMLARHGWRKLAPDTQHAHDEPQAREDWKNSFVALVEVVAIFAKVRPLRPMFQDAARFGLISDTRHRRACRPMHPMVKAMVTHQYTYAYGAFSPLAGRCDSFVLPHVNTECMQLFITEIAQRLPDEGVVMVIDGAGWHQSKGLKPPETLRLHFLPSFSPELNPQEHLWDELREKYFHNQAFESLDALEALLLAGPRRREEAPGIVKSISAWDWILHSVFHANQNWAPTGHRANQWPSQDRSPYRSLSPERRNGRQAACGAACGG